jgi:hypothetical protein
MELEKTGQFSKPYHPNDGHGPGVPLPDQVHDFLLKLDGSICEVPGAMKFIEDLWPGCKCEDHGDYIGIAQKTDHGLSRWWGIGYEVVVPPQH